MQNSKAKRQADCIPCERSAPSLLRSRGEPSPATDLSLSPCGARDGFVLAGTWRCAGRHPSGDETRRCSCAIRQDHQPASGPRSGSGLPLAAKSCALRAAGLPVTFIAPLAMQEPASRRAQMSRSVRLTRPMTCQLRLGPRYSILNAGSDENGSARSGWANHRLNITTPSRTPR